jgi:hypothetical protein
MAQSGHYNALNQCPLLGAKRTSLIDRLASLQYQHSRAHRPPRDRSNVVRGAADIAGRWYAMRKSQTRVICYDSTHSYSRAISADLLH